MRTRKSLFLVLLTGLCAALVACGQQPSASVADQPGGPGMSKDEVEQQDAATSWANDYCLAVGSLVDGLATMPTVDPSTAQRAVQTSSDLLASVISGLDKAVQGLNQLPPSPVPGGDGVRANAVASFTAVRARAADAKARLDSARDSTKIDQETLGAAREPLDEVSKLDLLAGFSSIPDLLTASAHAPVCEQLTSEKGQDGAIPG
ncbi:MAG TPA: hypothetical protein VFG87_00280 [Amycolatopsis sp.]|nr:hypothetical protein [Amycolatopsis sp.]